MSFCWIFNSARFSLDFWCCAWNHLGVTAPNTPIGTTLDFPFQILSSCSCNPWYFSVFSCSFFLMLLHILLLVKHHDVWLVGQQLLVCLELEVPLDLSPIILKCLQRCPIGNSNPYEAQIFTYIVLATWPCLLMYTVPACSLHPATMCCTALGAPLDSLQPGSCQVRKRLLTLCCCIGPSPVLPCL